MSPLPGTRWFAWLRNPMWRVGVLTGIYLSVLLGAWLVIANRLTNGVSADTRNTVTGVLAAMVMSIPFLRFLGSPGRLFACGITAWTLLTCTYLVMGIFVFERLFMRLGPLHVFMPGAAVYGFVSVIVWVVTIVLIARHQPIIVPRHRTYHSGR